MYEVPDPSVPAGTVVQVVQAGYMIGERVLRPALVAVSKGGAKASAPRQWQRAELSADPEGTPCGRRSGLVSSNAANRAAGSRRARRGSAETPSPSRRAGRWR